MLNILQLHANSIPIYSVYEWSPKEMSKCGMGLLIALSVFLIEVTRLQIRSFISFISSMYMYTAAQLELVGNQYITMVYQCSTLQALYTDWIIVG